MHETLPSRDLSLPPTLLILSLSPSHSLPPPHSCILPIKSVPFRNYRRNGVIRCVPIEDQFRCQASMCHLDVFTAAQIIHATLWSWYKPRTKSARVKCAGGTVREEEGGEKERRRKDGLCKKNAGVDRSSAAGSPGRRVDVKNQAYARGPPKGGILYSKLSDFYHCSLVLRSIP